MKKILSIAAALVVAAAFISCGDSGDSFEADTVISVGTPSVTAKAYPGVNYITWTPVEKAKSYEIYRAVGDGAPEFVKEITVASNAELGYADYAKNDFELVDGVTYKYTIVVVGGGTNPSRDVYVKAAKSTASVKATVPAYGTDLTAFTDKTLTKYLANFADEAAMTKAGVIKPALIDDVVYAKSTYNISLAYPVIPGFKYAVKLINETKVAAGIEQKKSTTGFTSNFKGSYVGNAFKDAFASGKYTAYLTVAAISDLYPTSAVYSLGSIEIKDIGELSGSATNTVKAGYDAAGKNVTVTWIPAKLTATNKATPVGNYKVYRASATDNYQTLTAVSGTVAAYGKESVTTASNNTNANVDDVYAIIDTGITDNTVGYKYYVVHTDGKLFGSYSAANEGPLDPYSLTETGTPVINSIDVVSTASTDIQNTLKVVVSKAAGDIATNGAKQTLELGYVKLDAVVSGTVTQTFDPSAFTAVTLGNPNYSVSGEQYTAYVKPTGGTGTYLFKLTAKETGKKDVTVYKIGVLPPAGATVEISGLTATKAASDKLQIQDTNINADTVGLYEYKVISIKKVTKNAYTDNVTITSTIGDAFSLSKAESSGDLSFAYVSASTTRYAALKAWAATPVPTETETTSVDYYVQKISKSSGAYALVKAY